MALPLLLLVCVVASLGSTAAADDWPQFRGPEGDGTTLDEAPTTWDRQTNVKWRTELPHPGNGSPIVVGTRVFLASANEDGTERSLLCFQRDRGDLLWTRTVKFAEKEPTHKTNPYNATTPASDGRFVVVSHGSAGLFCYDLEGRLKWEAQPGPIRHMWGYASSPIISGNRVLVNWGPNKQIFLAAYSLSSGEQLFKIDEPVDGDGDRNSAGNYSGSWATPRSVVVDDRRLVVCAMPTRVVGIDQRTGERVWHCDGLRGPRGDLAYASPHISGRQCVVIGGFRGPSFAFTIRGSGDLTDQQLWREDQNPQCIGSGVIVGEHLYIGFAGPNTIECIEVATGKRKWRQRSTAGAHWASTILAGSLLYATGQDGETLVFKPNPDKFELIARNPLKETCNATPAVSEGQIFIRTYNALYCIDDPDR